MAREVALDNIFLRQSCRWAHTEYSLMYHREYFSRRTGLAPQDPAFSRAIYDVTECDFIFMTNDGLVDWSQTGRVTDMGHAVYARDGSDRRQPSASPFQAVEEVWSFDAVAEYGLPDFQEQVSAYEKLYQDYQRDYPGQLTTGGYYRTIVSGAIAAFGWEKLLEAAADVAKMEKVFDGFFRRTLFHMEAWAQTSAEVIIQHDDFVWSSGPFMNPDIYRKIIIPRYARLWKVLHDAGKKVLFCSDGTFTMFMEDLAQAGAHGFIFEPSNDFAWVVENFGASHCLVGSAVDCRDLTLGHREKVKSDIKRTFKLLTGCRGAIVAVGNHLPANIPETMLDEYFKLLLPCLKK
ncbi:MAG TPA: uroporphyrinogen decarboxylase family protein [bacterium]|nr:uroporphyrinogen decarboxylase family protein [bacterium]